LVRKTTSEPLPAVDLREAIAGFLRNAREPAVLEPGEELLPLDLLDRVLLGDVAGFVAHDAGELRFVLEVEEQSLGDVEEAAGQREGVDLIGVHHAVPPRQVFAIGLRGELVTDAIDVSLHPRRRIQPAELLLELRSRLLTHLDLVFAADGAARCREADNDQEDTNQVCSNFHGDFERIARPRA
jgi:hypothetical protein